MKLATMKLVKMLTLPVKASIISFGFALLAAMSVQAASIAYNGANNGDWFAPENWDSQQVPTADDDVTIGNGKAVKAQTGAIAVKSLTITGTGSALYLGKSDLAPQTIATVSENLTVTDGAKLYVYAGALPDTEVFKDAITDQTVATAAIYANPTVVSVGGTLEVGTGGVVYSENEALTGAAVFFKPKDFNLAAGGEVNAVSLGWKLVVLGSTPDGAPPYAKVFKGSGNYAYSYAFGLGCAFGFGAGYGGEATDHSKQTNPEPWESGVTYGSKYAPFLPGSVGGYWSDGKLRGGGSIVVLATGAVTLDGLLDADTNQNVGSNNDGRPSGGGIWVCGETVEIGETAVLRARGSEPSNGAYPNAAGAGGRISVCEVPASQWDVLAAAPTTEDPAGFLVTELAQADVSGAYNAQKTKKAGDGTAVRITYTLGKTQLKVRTDPEGLSAEGVVPGDFAVKCAEELTYASGVFAYVDVNARYVRTGWTVKGASGAVVASGIDSPAVFTLADASDEPYVLTWSFATREVRHQVVVAGPGRVTVNGQPTTETLDIWTAEDAVATDALVATADAGATFAGWYGNIPGGKSTDAAATVTHAKGDFIAAVFVSEDIVPATKTWTGASGNRWDDAANWDPAGVPSVDSDVVIPSGTVYVPVGLVAHSVSVGANAKLYLGAEENVKGEILFKPYETSFVRFAKVLGDFTSAGAVSFGQQGGDAITASVFEFGGDLTLTGAAKVGFHAAAAMGDEPLSTNALLSAATLVSVGGALSVGGTAVLSPNCEAFSGAAIRFTCDSLTVDEGAAIDATTGGWNWRRYEDEADPRARVSGSGSGTAGFETAAFGPGSGYGKGAGHGGRGSSVSKDTGYLGGATYGYATAPFLPGSPQGVYTGLFNQHGNSSAGGGVVWIRSAKKATINGTVSADGYQGPPGGDIYGGASGGSVWIAASGLSAGEDASLNARGGNVNYGPYPSAGGGGRISLALGVSDEEYAALAAGERPASLTYVEAIDAIRADVSGGRELNSNLPLQTGPTGTVMLVKGSLSDTTVHFIGTPVAAIAPPLGYKTSAFDYGSEQTFVATADGYGCDPVDPANVRWSYAGYVVSNATEQIAEGTARSVTLTIPRGEIFVYWRWRDKETAVRADNPQGEAFGTVKINGESHPSGGYVWGLKSDSFTFEAVPAEGYEFLYWAGEFPYGQAKTNPLTLTSDRTRRIWPVFRLAEAPTTRVWVGGNHPVGSQGQVFPWLDPDNWSPKNIPGPEDDVVFDATGSTACFATNNYVEVKSLTVGGDHRLWVGAMSDHSSRPFTKMDFYHTTLTPATEELTLVVAGDVAVSNTSEIAVGSWVQTQAAHTRVLVGGDLTLAEKSLMLVAAGATTEDFTFARGAGELTVGGTFTVGSEA